MKFDWWTKERTIGIGKWQSQRTSSATQYWFCTRSHVKIRPPFIYLLIVQAGTNKEEKMRRCVERNWTSSYLIVDCTFPSTVCDVNGCVKEILNARHMRRCSSGLFDDHFASIILLVLKVLWHWKARANNTNYLYTHAKWRICVKPFLV